MSEMLSERKKNILKAVIEEYISSGEPIGSKFLASLDGISLSPATLRNEMAELTEMGYLVQPHTSAGRIPSEQGYRFYVDTLMQSYDLTASEMTSLQEMLRDKEEQLDKIIDSAGRLMASLTNYPAISVRSVNRVSKVMKFSILFADDYHFLLIMILPQNNVKTKTVKSPFRLTEEGLLGLQNVLNKYLVDVRLDALTLAQMMELENMLGPYGALVTPIIKCIYEALGEGSNGNVRVDGVDRLLGYPEYSSVDKLRSVLSTLEQRESLLELVENTDESGVSVFIGSENSVETMSDSTLIMKTITVGGKKVGAIGVIGPCRMDYSKVISTVDQLVQSITEHIGADDLGNLLPEAQDHAGEGEKND
ncbi:MAG: heat-inducible transcription repressor HrcA [Clostridia bacterium]|nr:heat-inducible transcription repressor HrcA [Clostridia bacterium]